MSGIKIIKRGARDRQAEAAATSTAQTLRRGPAQQLKREVGEVITGWVREWREQEQDGDARRAFGDLFRPHTSGC